MSALVRIRDLGVDFTSAVETVRAVSGVSFDIERGETMALVGESGSGQVGNGALDPPAPALSGRLAPERQHRGGRHRRDRRVCAQAAPDFAATGFR